VYWLAGPLPMANQLVATKLGSQALLHEGRAPRRNGLATIPPQARRSRPAGGFPAAAAASAAAPDGQTRTAAQAEVDLWQKRGRPRRNC